MIAQPVLIESELLLTLVYNPIVELPEKLMFLVTWGTNYVWILTF